MNVMQCDPLLVALDKEQLQQIAYTLSIYLTDDQLAHFLYLAEHVIFNIKLYKHDIGLTNAMVMQCKEHYAIVLGLEDKVRKKQGRLLAVRAFKSVSFVVSN